MRIAPDQWKGAVIGSLLICLFSTPILAAVSGLFTLGLALMYNGLCQWKPRPVFVLRAEGLPLAKQVG